MSLTLQEIIEHQDRLRREIVERECLLAAFNVLHGYAANGQGHDPAHFGVLVSALSQTASPKALPNAVATPAAAALPAPAPEPPYMHPELKALNSSFGSNVAVVRWAIARMTEDYSLADIQKLLLQEGSLMRGAQISVVLSRMRTTGEIQEIERSYGPIPARFRGRAKGASFAPLSDERADAVAAATVA